jgi:hypothetical protein
MEELIKLSKFLNAYRLEQVDIIGSDDSKSRYTEFYTLLKKDKLKSDDAAVKHFYGDKATDKNQSYRQLKSTLRDRLLNSLFFIDINHPHFTDLETATMTIQKEWAAINIIFAKGEINLATLLAEDLLPTARKYELTEIVVYITDRLKEGYGTQLDDRKKYVYYKSLQKEQMEIWQAEIKAKELFQEMRIDYITSAANQPEKADIARVGLEELEPALKKYKTFRLIIYAYFVKMGQYTTAHNFKPAVKLADDAIEILKSKPFNAQRAINIFLNQKLVCHIHLKEFAEAQAVAKEILPLQVEGSLGWFKTLEHTTLLAFHTKNYEEAYVIYKQARASEKFGTLQLRHLEIWHLFRAYLYFMVCNNKIKKATLKSEEFRDFRLTKFMNDVTVFGRDSSGMKISVLIIEVALTLVSQNYGKMIDASDALEKYRQRHVSKDNALYRHNIMIKMIEKIPRCAFGKVQVKKVTEVLFRNMKQVPMQTDGQSAQSEIIPFEEMWDFIVNTLKK